MQANLELSYKFVERHPLDAAPLFEKWPAEAAAGYLNAAPPQAAASLLKSVNPFTASQLLEALALPQAEAICRKLSLGTNSTLLRRVSSAKRQQLLAALPPDFSSPLQSVLRHAEGTAGALMKSRILVLTDDVTVAEALRQLRRFPEQIFDYTYIVDRHQVLVGFVNVRHLMLAPPESRVSSVMQKNVGRLLPQTGRKAILTHPGWRLVHALPVADENGVFLGAVAYQTLRKLEDEAASAQPDVNAANTGKALGELYWLGISALINGAATAIEGERKNR